MGNSQSATTTLTTTTSILNNGTIKSDAHTDTENNTKQKLDVIFCNNYICALLLLSEIPIMESVKTHGDLLAYIHGRNIMLNDYSDINNAQAYVCTAYVIGKQNCQYGNKGRYRYCQYDNTASTWITYTYAQCTYKEFYNRKMLPDVTIQSENYYYGSNKSDPVLFKSLMFYFLAIFDPRQSIRNPYEEHRKKIFSLETMNEQRLELLRSKIKNTINTINSTIEEKLKWTNEHDKNVLLNDLECCENNINSLKLEKEKLEKELMNFHNMTDDEYYEIVKNIKTNINKQHNYDSDLIKIKNLIRSLDNVENFCNVCKLQIKILQHFLFVTSWCDKLKLEQNDNLLDDNLQNDNLSNELDRGVEV